MTQEEKAMAYDEAIKRAKGWYIDAQIDFKKSLEALFPEPKESEDEQIRKEIVSAINIYCSEYLRGTKVRNAMLAWLEKQGEKKPTDKVEPKFHKGDWIVFNGLTLYVNDVVQGYYRTISIGGIPNSYDWDIDNAARLWSIQDAKDGDVLAFKDGTSGILLYKECTENFGVLSHCRIVRNSFIDKEESGWGLTLLSPATKEQRDLLFQKMKEAGYTWDSEKKELKEIIDEKQIKKNLQDNRFRRMFEQKCSEDDSVRLQRIIDFLWHNRKGDTDTIYQQEQDIDWLKSLKDVVQPKPSWSEEDEKMLVDCFNIFHRSDYPIDKVSKAIEWLKSLKDRVRPHKSEWSRDDEQYLLVCKNALAKYQVSDKWDASIIYNWLKNKLQKL